MLKSLFLKIKHTDIKGLPGLAKRRLAGGLPRGAAAGALGGTSLKAKFIALFLLIGLIPVILVALFSFFNAKNNIEDAVLRSLNMYSGLVQSQMNDYFAKKEAGAAVFAMTGDVFLQLQILREADLDRAAQDEGYARWVEEQRRILDTHARLVVENYNFSYIYVTDRDGKIVMSTDTRLNNINIRDRDYVIKSLEGQKNWTGIFLSDLLDERVVVLSVPIRIHGHWGQVIGTANFAIRGNMLDSFVHSGIESLGSTGNAYLVDEQGLMLTNSLLGEHAANAALTVTKNTEAVKTLSGQISAGNAEFHYGGVHQDHTGKEVLGAARVIVMGERFAGLVVEVSADEAFTGVNRMQSAVTILLIITVVAVVFVGLYVAAGTAKPISRIAAVAEKVASGDFTIMTEISRNDEIGQLANAFNKMNESLRNLMRQAVTTATGVNEGSDSLSKAVESVSASVSQVAASSNEFATGTQHLSAKADEMAELSGEVEASAGSGGKVVEDAARQMREINEMVADLGDVIRSLDGKSQQIGSIVNMITDVAEQTNLLALNAAIEAARVGEHGRGFAVVADEVRKLSVQTRNSAEEIAALVKETQAVSGNAVIKMQNGIDKVRAGTEVVLESGKAFQAIVKNVREIVRSIETVSSVAQQISAGSEEIAASTQEQSSVMEEINASAEELKVNADMLIQELKRFKYEL